VAAEVAEAGGGEVGRVGDDDGLEAGALRAEEGQARVGESSFARDGLEKVVGDPRVQVAVEGPPKPVLNKKR
jgi:hypothetical protein